MRCSTSSSARHFERRQIPSLTAATDDYPRLQARRRCQTATSCVSFPTSEADLDARRVLCKPADALTGSGSALLA